MSGTNRNDLIVEYRSIDSSTMFRGVNKIMIRQFRQNSTDDLHSQHIPTNCLQNGVLFVGSAIGSFFNPYRADLVALLSETTGDDVLRKLYHRMICDPIGKQILEERPRINSEILNFQKLSLYPEGTLGKCYADFMMRNKITSDSRNTVRFIADPDLAYVLQRYREIHDFSHVLSGLPTTSYFNEIVVKAFEYVHTGIPMCLLATVAGVVRISDEKRQQLFKSYLPWAYRCGRKSHLLLNIYFEKILDMPVTELYKNINYEPAPKYTHFKIKFNNS